MASGGRRREGVHDGWDSWLLFLDEKNCRRARPWKKRVRQSDPRSAYF